MFKGIQPNLEIVTILFLRESSTFKPAYVCREKERNMMKRIRMVIIIRVGIRFTL